AGLRGIPRPRLRDADGSYDDLATARFDKSAPARLCKKGDRGMTDENTLLDVKGLSVRFGGIHALNNVSFQVRKGSITALIGPNGAGKTTVFNCLTGFYKATSGSIRLRERGGGELDIVKVLGEPFRATDFINPVQLASRLYYKMFGG